VHGEYFQAGADVAITASYQASYEGFARRGLSSADATSLLQQTVRLAAAAREDYLASLPAEASAADARPLIAASIGPYGAALADGSEYRGHYTLDDAALAKFHAPRLAALLAAGPDLLACETIPSLREALVLARLLAQYPTACAWISFACRDGTHTCEGQDLAECARALDDFGEIAAIGVNCTAPEHVPSLLRRLRAHTDRPLLAYPNSGERYDAATKRWSGSTRTDTRMHTGATAPGFAAQAREWYAAGARLIGGCCRTTPGHIRAIRETLSLCA